MVISKGMVIAAAVIAFGLVAVDDVTKGLGRASSFMEAQAATTDATVVQNGALRARAAQSLRTLIEKQAGEPSVRMSEPTQKCRAQNWPYYTDDCLVRSDGREITAVTRIVGVDRLVSAPVRLAGLH